MKNQSNPSRNVQPAILAAIRHILRPLVRLLLSHTIPFQTFCDVVKSVYVNIADREFRLASKPQTDSRISLLTGIHRREVNRLRNEAPTEINLSSHLSLSALLLTIWSGHPEYLDERGLPIPLPRLAHNGDNLSFESLVQSVSKDFRPRVVLDEWLRQEIVTLDSQDRVHLRVNAFVPPQDLEEKIFYFGQNIHDHLAATVHNLTEGGSPFLERCVFYDKLSAESVKELAEYSRVVGMKALHAINRRAAELQKRDQGQHHSHYRSNFGIYNFSETEDSDETPSD